MSREAEIQQSSWKSHGLEETNIRLKTMKAARTGDVKILERRENKMVSKSSKSRRIKTKRTFGSVPVLGGH